MIMDSAFDAAAKPSRGRVLDGRRPRRPLWEVRGDMWPHGYTLVLRPSPLPVRSVLAACSVLSPFGPGLIFRRNKRRYKRDENLVFLNESDQRPLQKSSKSRNSSSNSARVPSLSPTPYDKPTHAHPTRQTELQPLHRVPES